VVGVCWLGGGVFFFFWGVGWEGFLVFVCVFGCAHPLPRARGSPPPPDSNDSLSSRPGGQVFDLPPLPFLVELDPLDAIPFFLF